MADHQGAHARRISLALHPCAVPPLRSKPFRVSTDPHAREADPSSARRSTVDPFYENIDGPKYAYDLSSHAKQHDSKDMEQYWAHKRGSPAAVPPSKAFSKMKLGANDQASGVSDQENAAAGNAAAASATSSVPVKMSKKKAVDASAAAPAAANRAPLQAHKKSVVPPLNKKDSVFERLFGGGASSARRATGGSTPSKNVSTKKVTSFSARKPAPARKFSKGRRGTGRKPKLTTAKSPNLHTKFRYARRSQRPETSLEREVREIQKLNQENEKRRKLNAEAVQRILGPRSDSKFVRRSTKQLTEPQEFNFATASRLGYKVPKSAKKNKRKPRTSLKPTRPVPFSLSNQKRTTNKVKPATRSKNMGTKKAQFVSVKTKVNNFFKRADKPRRSVSATVTAELTGPVSPNLATKSRASRKPAATVLTTEQREEQEIKAMSKFKARPVDKKIFTCNGEYGVPRVAKKKPTKFQEFQLSKYAAGRKKTSATRAPAKPFKATPFNPKLFKKAPKVKKAKAAELTNPVSPPLHTKKLVHRYIRDEYKGAEDAPATKPAGRQSIAPSTSSYVPGRTVPQEFRLRTQARGRQYEQERKERIRQKNEAAKVNRVYKAKPVPKYPTFKGHEEVVQVTTPVPFEFRGEEYRKRAQARFAEMIAREQAAADRKAQFKARDIQQNDNFFLFASRKPLTTVEPFALCTKQRERESFHNREEFRKAREDAEAKAKAEEAAKKAQEEAEDRAWRRQCVHKPVPILKGKPIQIKRSTKPLTQPITPSLKTDARSHAK